MAGPDAAAEPLPSETSPADQATRTRPPRPSHRPRPRDLVLARWFDDFPDAHLRAQRLYVVVGMAVEEGTFTGTHLGAARTGRTVALEYVQVLRFRYSKCVSLTLTFDRLVILEQLGLTAGDEHIGTAATAGDPSELVDESGR